MKKDKMASKKTVSRKKKSKAKTRNFVKKLSFFMKSIFIFLKKSITFKNGIVLGTLVISGLILLVGTSYSIFTVNQVKSGALNITAGNLYATISSSAFNSSNQVTVAAKQSLKFNVTLKNNNSISARLNFYYKTSNSSCTSVGYSPVTANTPSASTTPSSMSSGSSKVYTIVVKNTCTSSGSITVTFTGAAGLASAALATPSGYSYISSSVLSYPAAPELKTPYSGQGSEMIPVVYDSTNGTSAEWEKSATTNGTWYDYDKQKWANAVTVDTSLLSNESNNYATRPGTIYGATRTSNYLSLDGTNDWVSTGSYNTISGTNLTFFLEFKPKSLATKQYIMGTWNGGGGGIVLDDPATSSDLEGTNNKVCLELYIGGWQQLCSSTTYTTSETIRVAAMYNGTTMYLYTKGSGHTSSNVVTKTYSGTVAGATSSDVRFVLGGNPSTTGIDANTYANVNIYEVAFYQGLSKTTTQLSNYVNASVATSSIITETTDSTKSGNLIFYFPKGTMGTVANWPNGTSIPMQAINTMWVWIPRYEYKYTNLGTSYAGGTQASPGTIGVDFVNSDVTTSFNSSGGIIHPAFETNYPGFWIGKFEMSPPASSSCNTTHNATNCNIDSSLGRIKPNLSSWNYISATKAVSAAHYIYQGTGFTTNLISNAEWGAATYLTQSLAGRRGVTSNQMYTNNYYSSYAGQTGCVTNGVSSTSSTTCNSYDSTIGLNGSTTNNVYGIYDMAGGMYEWTNYSYSTSNTVTESSKGYAFSETKSWQSAKAVFANSTNPCLARGGSYNAFPNIFTYDYAPNSTYVHIGWRAMLND